MNVFNGKADSTRRCSQAVPHPSTNRALRRLTSEVGRDPVYSTRYGRQRNLLSTYVWLHYGETVLSMAISDANCSHMFDSNGTGWLCRRRLKGSARIDYYCPRVFESNGMNGLVVGGFRRSHGAIIIVNMCFKAMGTDGVVFDVLKVAHGAVIIVNIYLLAMGMDGVVVVGV